MRGSYLQKGPFVINIRYAGLIGLLLGSPFSARADDAAGLIPPEVVRVESASADATSKRIIVGNDNGSYTLWCNIKAVGCNIPAPGIDYYVFKDDTRWKMPGATGLITLAFIEYWTVIYNNAQNIGLAPKIPGGTGSLGIYIFESWATKKR